MTIVGLTWVLRHEREWKIVIIMKYNQVRREEEWLEEPEEICRLAFLSEKILHGRCPRCCEDHNDDDED